MVNSLQSTVSVFVMLEEDFEVQFISYVVDAYKLTKLAVPDLFLSHETLHIAFLFGKFNSNFIK